MTHLRIEFAGRSTSLLLGLAVGSVFLGVAGSPLQSPSKNPGISTAEIASQVEATLVNAAYLHMTGSASELEKQVTFEAHMCPDRYKLHVFDKNQLVLGWAWANGRVTEYRPKMERRPIVERDTDEPDGTAPIVFTTELDCFFGTATQYWVGEQSHQAHLLRRQIEASNREADATVANRPCFVCRHEFPYGKEKTGKENMAQHTFYIDQQTFLLRRWETLNHGVLRVRNYDISLGHVPTNMSWNVAVGDEERCSAPTPPNAN